jgi:hypothetical protein
VKQAAVARVQPNAAAKPVAPVQEKNVQPKEVEQKTSSSQPQKPASPPQKQQNSHPPAPKVESAPKK